MNKKLMIKICFYFIILFLFSCVVFSTSVINEYTVTKKSPLVMPPDMNMCPPDGKKKSSVKSYEKVIK